MMFFALAGGGSQLLGLPLPGFIIIDIDAFASFSVFLRVKTVPFVKL
jgi:hypothetical protein